jgi:hypothetical protein
LSAPFARLGEKSVDRPFFLHARIKDALFASLMMELPVGQGIVPKEVKMMTNRLRLLATASAIGVGVIGALPDASAQAPRYRHLRSQDGFISRSYRPPPGQIYQRSFRNAPTPEGRARQDFQLDGSIGGN